MRILKLELLPEKVYNRRRIERELIIERRMEIFQKYADILIPFTSLTMFLGRQTEN